MANNACHLDISCFNQNFDFVFDQFLYPYIVRSGELLPAIRESLSAGNDAKATKLLAGGLKQLKLSRLKPDKELNSSLMVLIKESPQLFSAPSSLDGLIAVLKREPSAIFKAKSNPSVYILAAKLLVLTLKDSFDWPESVAKVEKLVCGERTTCICCVS